MKNQTTTPIPTIGIPIQNAKFTFWLRFDELRAIRLFRSRDSTRWITDSVHFEVSENGILAVATNGRVMAIMKLCFKDKMMLSDAKEMSFTIDYPLLEKVKRPKTGDVAVVIGEYQTLLTIGEDSILCQHKEKLSGVYPMWRAVVPRSPMKPQDLTFNLAYYDLFQKASKLIVGTRNEAVVIVRGHADAADYEYQPYSILMPQAPNFYGMLMPVRAEIPDRVPEFVLPLPEPNPVPASTCAPQPQPEPATV